MSTSQRSVGVLCATAAVITTALPVSAMVLEHCNRPDASQRANHHPARHYVENPGPIRRTDVNFYSYSLLDPPSGNTHQIRYSFCNAHQDNSLSFKWEPIGLAYRNLPKAECYCVQPPLNLTHNDIEILDVNDAHIQFINTSATNRLPASAFLRKNRTTEKAPVTSIIDVIRQKADQLRKETFSFFSFWEKGAAVLQVAGQTDERFLLAIEMPAPIFENVREQLTDRQTVGLTSTTVSDLKIQDRSWIPDKLSKSRIVAVSQKIPKFSDVIFSAKAAEVDPAELQVAVFTNDDNREFVAAAPIVVYAPTK